MRVLMLGWEFPPFISGGLGTACYGLTKALSSLGQDILFLLPRPVSSQHSTHVTLVVPPPPATPAPHDASGAFPQVPPTPVRVPGGEFEHVSFRTVDSAHPTTGPASPYARPDNTLPKSVRQLLLEERARALRPTEIILPLPPPPPLSPTAAPAPVAAESPTNPENHYSGDLFAEVQRYANLATDIARTESFDVIHAHDWMTYPAALAVAAASNKPLVVHVHSTEFDRAGNHIDQRIYDIERRGMHAAVKVIAVSHLTKSVCAHHYGLDNSKIEVIHNAIDLPNSPIVAGLATGEHKFHANDKIVLFLGRITFQKGPEYFLAAAKKVLEVMDNVKFVMAGSGDMIPRTIELAASLGIGHKVLFTGFLRGPDVERVFKMADLYVMPSVSEPFGIAPLEAMSNDVPVIISKQSGVSEVLSHALKVDFWDVAEMANKIVAVLRHPPLASSLRQHGAFEVRKLSWTDAAKSCLSVYQNARSAIPALPPQTTTHLPTPKSTLQPA